MGVFYQYDYTEITKNIRPWANELQLKGLESPSKEQNSKYTKLPASRDLKHSELEGTLEHAHSTPIIADNSILQSGKKLISEKQVALTNSTVYANADELNDQIKSMMTKSNINSDSRGRVAVCNMCGKEGQWNGIRDHIEANHITGVSHSCGKMFNTRWIKLAYDSISPINTTMIHL